MSADKFKLKWDVPKIISQNKIEPERVFYANYEKSDLYILTWPWLIVMINFNFIR